MPDPLFILAPHRSYTSVVCAMLGQHPQMYGLPELNLFVAETMQEWWTRYRNGAAMATQGLWRALAEVFQGEQTVRTVRMVRRWIGSNLDRTTTAIFQDLVAKLAPRVVVEKSPSTTSQAEFLERVGRAFPNAYYLHLLRHPRSYSESVLSMPMAKLYLSYYDYYDYSVTPPILEPQKAWYGVNTLICRFLEGVPESRKMRLRGEDILADLDRHLVNIAAWLGLRTDRAAIESMKYPERGPFSHFGPPGAVLGNDPKFLRHPELQPNRAKPGRLDGPLAWRDDGVGFFSEVRQLAQEFGYK